MACLIFNGAPQAWDEDVWARLESAEASLPWGRRETDRLEEALAQGRKDLLALAFRGMERQLRERLWEPEPCREELLHFCRRLEAWARERQALPEQDGEREKCLLALGRSDTLAETLENLRRYLTALLTACQGQESAPLYVRQGAAFIEANYMRDLSLPEIAGAVSMNPWYFSTQFKKYMGLATGEYLNEVRVRAAVALMRESDLKLGEIAELVGFQDSAYFSSVFRRIKKVSPREYRKRMKGSDS